MITMGKIDAEARCPILYYEEIMKKDFNKWSKMQLVAYINMNSDENNQVTMRPRKSTLVKRAENMKLMAEAEKELDPRKPEHPLATIAGFLTLIGVFGFFAIIALEFVSFWSDIPLAHLFGVLAIFGMIFGIPFYVWKLERKYK